MLVAAILAALEAVDRTGTGILLVEQNVVRALPLSRRGSVLENGAIVLAGGSAELLQNPQGREAYLGR